MKRNIIMVIIATASISVGGIAVADSGYGTGHHELTERSESTHSGDTMKGHFDHMDANDDGVVSRNEIDAHDDRDQWFKRNALYGEFANPGF